MFVSSFLGRCASTYNIPHNDISAISLTNNLNGQKNLQCGNNENKHEIHSIVDCKLCSTKLSRGGMKSGLYRTSSLIIHLKTENKIECDKKTTGRNTSKQQSAQHA